MKKQLVTVNIQPDFIKGNQKPSVITLDNEKYPRHCTTSSLKMCFVELIDTMPPHEGKTFEEALADWLIENGATLPKEG